MDDAIRKCGKMESNFVFASFTHQEEDMRNIILVLSYKKIQFTNYHLFIRRR